MHFPERALGSGGFRGLGGELGIGVNVVEWQVPPHELADTFDEMLARLEAAFASQRRFVANASHELRTPLTEMRTLIDVTTARPSWSTCPPRSKTPST
jgi:signal transduction histidine kinase